MMTMMMMTMMMLSEGTFLGCSKGVLKSRTIVGVGMLKLAVAFLRFSAFSGPLAGGQASGWWVVGELGVGMMRGGGGA